MGNELIALGGAFLAAGVLARLGRRVGLPTIPFFMAAGILFGPNTPGIVLIEDVGELSLLAALGLILLLFHLGLEFSLGDLVGGGRRLLYAGGAYLALNVGGGFVFGLLLGWGTPEALVVAGAVGISSSAIVTKLLVELRRLANPESRLILGIIVVEDVFLALYLAILQPVRAERRASPAAWSSSPRPSPSSSPSPPSPATGHAWWGASSPPVTTSCSPCASSAWPSWWPASARSSGCPTPSGRSWPG